MTRFKDFTSEELAYIGVGLALAGKELDAQEAVTPLIAEVNRELDECAT